MFIYSIIGLFLSLSPINLNTPFFDFPYSFLGIALYFLTVFLDNPKEKVWIDSTILFAMIISITLNRLMIYHGLINFFLIYNFTKIGLKRMTFFSELLVICGIVLAISSFFIALTQVMSTVILIILLNIEEYIENKEIIQTSIPNKNLENNTIIIPRNNPSISKEISNANITKDDSSGGLEEKEFVIPNSRKK